MYTLIHIFSAMLSNFLIQLNSKYYSHFNTSNNSHQAFLHLLDLQSISLHQCFLAGILLRQYLAWAYFLTLVLSSPKNESVILAINTVWAVNYQPVLVACVEIVHKSNHSSRQRHHFSLSLTIVLTLVGELSV